MKRILQAVMMVGLIGYSCSYSLAAEVVYVQSTKAKIMSAPSFRSVVVGTVSLGQRLTVVGKEKDWVKVLFDYQKGYIPSLLVSSQPPLKKVTLLKMDQKDDFSSGVRRRASTYTSAAAARGLTADDRSRLSTAERASYDAVERMEAFRVSNEEIAKFLEVLK